jgi:hypothetical protein
MRFKHRAPVIVQNNLYDRHVAALLRAAAAMSFSRNPTNGEEIMQNTNENDAREGRANEMDTLRDLYMSIIDCDQTGANIDDEIGNLFAGLSVADPNSVCWVANFVIDGPRDEDEADFAGEPTLMATWDTLLERLIPWLERRGYEKHGINWQSPGSA